MTQEVTADAAQANCQPAPVESTICTRSIGAFVAMFPSEAMMSPTFVCLTTELAEMAKEVTPPSL